MSESTTDAWVAPPAPAPIGPEMLEQPFPWLELGLLLVGLIILGLLGFYLWKKRASKAQPEPTAAELALQCIAEAKSEDGAVPVEVLSLIFRSYLNAVIDDPAVYQTVEEFRQREQSLQKLPQVLRDESLRLLGKLDDQKYRADGDEAFEKSSPPLVREIILKIDEAMRQGPEVSR